MKYVILVQGFYYETKVYNLVSGQTASVGDNSDSYDIKVDKLARIIDLLESNLNQYFDKWVVFVVRTYWILNVIPTHAKPVLNISTNPWFARDAIAFTLEQITTGIIGHISVELVYSLNFDLIIFIILFPNCNIYDKAFKRWLFRVVQRNIW